MIELDVLNGAEASTAGESDEETTRFWRSEHHRTQSAAFQETHEDEFMTGVSQPPGGASRRQFLQLSGALLAMAGLSACEPAQKVMPYSRKPEEVIPGVARYYATGMPLRGSLEPLLVENHEGRPTKVEGNPDHPLAEGSSGVFAQASVLNLYDPDRSGRVLREGDEATWQEFVNFSRNFAADAEAKHVAVLSEPTSSPTVKALRENLRERYGEVSWVTYAPEGENSFEQAMQQHADRRLRPLYHFDEADVVVSLDANFLGPTAKNYLHNTRTFARSRQLASPDDAMSRLYVAESDHTITGGMADHRLPVRSSDVPALAQALASALGVGGGTQDASLPEEQQRFVQRMAEDLKEAGEQGIVLAGETQPPAVHALCMALNDRLGSTGTTVTLLDPQSGEDAETQPRNTAPQRQQLKELVSAMRGGQVDALLMLGTNPLYSLPPDLGFETAMQRVPETIHLGLHVDETAQKTTWHLPRTHYLEHWGDGRAYDGTLSVVQPLIAPLYEAAHSDIEVLNVFATGLDMAGYDIVRERWRERLGGTFEDQWRKLLHDGFLPDTQFDEASASVGSASSLPVPGNEDELEVVFRLDPTVLDGRFSNNAWCQELPAPTTKITWDNVAVMSPRTAEEHGLTAEYSKGQYYVDVVELSVNGQTVTLPVWVQPGHADGSISVTLGYGRDLVSTHEEPEEGWFDFFDAYDTTWEEPGPLANQVGENVAPLRSSDNLRVAAGASLQKTGETYMIATTQDHGALDPEARPLFRMATKEEYEQNPDFVQEQGEPSPEEPFDQYPMLWEDNHPAEGDPNKDNPYHENQWGMVIDLNTCTGCNACIVACNAENNIQVVGKDQVAQGREMHWLRVDRYWVSDETDKVPENPNMVLQPVPCMHCENAPCESVCPVSATVHSPDGTNQMIYNRCIGTRYCSNNCPYKVRRFNFYNWTQALPAEVQMAQNPDVTVRSRGVMEKCSYCIQRIRETGRRAQLEDRPIRDGEVQTACQQACPANAITFGDVADPDTKVSQKKRNSRRYEMLDELNTKPRTSYLGRVRNPNRQLEPAAPESEHDAPAEGEDAHS